MTAKSYLQQIGRMKAMIRQRSQELDALRASNMGYKAIDYSADRVQTSPTDRMADTVGKYIDMETEIMQMIDAYFEKMHMIIGQIQALDDARHIDILYARYVNGESLRRIARDMHYEYGYACRLHGRALKAFSDKWTIKDN